MAQEDKEREERIAMEIVVDAYDEAERALGWYYYLQDKLQFPFRARCVSKRAISPLRADDVVEVTGMSAEEECEHEMFVTIAWREQPLDVPLAQLEPLDASDETQESVADWHYWVANGYAF
jgi:Calcium binding